MIGLQMRGVVRLAIAAGLLAASVNVAIAFGGENCRFEAWGSTTIPGAVCTGIVSSSLYTGLSVDRGDLSAQSAVSVPSAATVSILSNVGATTLPGEPTEGGQMQKTQWGTVLVRENRRIVLHTFGSSFDTLLAVYRGTALNNLVRITGNDNRAVPGIGAVHSLVQFNATANEPYNFQIGSKGGAEGDIVSAAFAFPPGGGLSAFLAKVDTTNWASRDYVCNNAQSVVCGNPLFILHNSTGKTLTVTASSNLGAGVIAPGAFTIAPNEIRTARFTFTAGFNKTTTRTVAGSFIFVGKEGVTEVTRTQHRALIVVEAAALGNVLRATVSPAIRSGFVNEAKPFDVVLRNTGPQAAIGCHARHDFSFTSRLKIVWRRFDPGTGSYIGAISQPFNLAAGQTASVRVFVASQQTQLADPEFPAPMTLDCANTDPAPINLFNTFDLTALGRYRPAQVDAVKLAPVGDTLDVPAAGTATARFSVKNRSAAAALRVLPVYVRPVPDWSNPNKQFTVTICRLASANGACLAAPTANGVTYNAALNSTAFFKVFVRAPAVDPGYSAALRRVFLKVWQNRPVATGTFDAPVAAESVAVRKN